MLVTVLLSLMMMAGLFLLLWGGVGVVALLGLMTAVLVMRKNRRKF